MPSLLEKALMVPVKRQTSITISEEEVELLQAYLADKITARQVEIALDKNIGYLNTFLARAMRVLAHEGRLEIK